MTFPRRMFLAGLVLTLAAISTSPARAIDPKYLPGDTELVLSLNFKQMLDSPVAKQYRELIDKARGAIDDKVQNNPAAKHLAQAGFDVLRDLHGVTIASNGGKELSDIFLVVEGNFNEDKINGVAEEAATQFPEALKISKIAGKKVYEITPPGEKRIYACLINEKTLVVSPTEDALQDAISGSARRGMKENFRSLLKTTSNKQSFSFTATGAALAKLMENAPVPNAEMVAGTLQQIDGLTAAITLTKDIQFQLGINAKDQEAAKKTADGGNFGLIMIRTMVQQKAKEDERLLPLVDIAKTLRITSDGTNVLLRGEVTLENLQKLIDTFGEKLNR
jgi:hypothetical protein